MEQPDAAHRVRARIKEWIQREGHSSKKRLAKAAGKGQSWVTGVLKGRDVKGQNLTLADLDAVAELLDVPPGELVRKSDRNYLELTMAETRLIQHYRSVPDTIKHNWIAFLDYLFLFHADAVKHGMNLRDKHTKRARQFEQPESRRNTG